MIFPKKVFFSIELRLISLLHFLLCNFPMKCHFISGHSAKIFSELAFSSSSCTYANENMDCKRESTSRNLKIFSLGLQFFFRKGNTIVRHHNDMKIFIRNQNILKNWFLWFEKFNNKKNTWLIYTREFSLPK